MCHQLVGLLGGRIQADRMVDAVVLRERHAGVAAIHARTAGIHQMRHLVVTAAFEDVHEADDVGVDVGVRILQRIAHAGLRGQMHHAVELLACKQLFHAGAVGHVELDEAEAFLRREARQTRLLESWIVVIVEIVETDDFVAARQQNLRYVAADEARSARDQHFHGEPCAR